MIHAILFDFDGLILDTEVPIFAAWQEIYAEFGAPLTLEEYAGCLGSDHHAFNPYEDLARKCGRSIIEEEIRPRLSTIYLNLIARNDALPGVRELLEEARQLDIRTAVASSSNRDWVERHLSRLGLLDSFDLIRTRNDVERVKPNPDLFLAALDGLGVRPEHAIVLEDSPNGVLAARRAGVFVVAVPSRLTCDLDLNEPDLCLPSLADLALPELIEHFRKRNHVRS